jgi:hypothetical protein
VVDVLLASPEFVDYWTFRFSDIFRVAIFANGLTPKWSQEYWEWIRSSIENNRPYDEIARERIAADGYDPASRHFIPYNRIGPPADTMAEEVRVFFGRRLDCAQCHNHPYENWSQGGSSRWDPWSSIIRRIWTSARRTSPGRLKSFILAPSCQCSRRCSTAPA